MGSAVLDGDILRAGLSADLGFGPTDRREQLRRVTELARLGLAQGYIVLVAVIAPEEEGRRWARAQFAARDFLLTHCRCSLSACASRDPKRALRAGAHRRTARVHRGVGAV